ncbi:hypothetical protein, partial [Acetivibrio cellulolyticus]
MDNKPPKAEKVGNTIKRILGETLEKNGFEKVSNLEWIRIDNNKEKIEFDKSPIAGIVRACLYKNWQQPFLRGKAYNDYMSRNIKSEGIFRKFNGVAAIQIEYLDLNGKIIRDYCNK